MFFQSLSWVSALRTLINQKYFSILNQNLSDRFLFVSDEFCNNIAWYWTMLTCHTSNNYSIQISRILVKLSVTIPLESVLSDPWRFSLRIVVLKNAAYKMEEGLILLVIRLWLTYCENIGTKRRRSDPVLWQKPLHQQKCQKGKVTTQTTPQKKFD